MSLAERARFIIKNPLNIMRFMTTLLGNCSIVYGLVVLPRYDQYFVTLFLMSVLFLLTVQSKVVLPSGSVWRPALPLVSIAMYILPPALTTLVAIPGLIMISVKSKQPWWKYLETFAHVSIGFFFGSLTYNYLLKIYNHSQWNILVALFIGQVVQLTLNRIISAAIVASRDNRSFGQQLEITFNTFHWGYYTANLVSVMSALIYFDLGIVAILLGMAIQFGQYRSLLYYNKMQEWQRKAFTDHVTGLSNRISWDSYVDSLEKNPIPGTLAVIDLDNFKNINDTLGHAVGDIVLREVGVKLMHEFSPDVRLFRFGGDEFVIYYPHNTETAEIVAQKIRSVAESFKIKLDRGNLIVEASIGLAVCPTDAEDITSLFNEADHNMYKVKYEKKSI